MYTIQEKKADDLHYIELANSNSTSKAALILNQRGRLSNLEFNSVQILADFQPSTYKHNYASSILFPFANRIKNGEYVFNNSDYKLECNEVGKNNAIHGLVYNKTFTCIEKTIEPDYASAVLHYKDNGTSKGFPFKYSINLTYTLNKSGLNLSIEITNEDEKTFPFTLGWHPYFKSSDLDKSTLNFKSHSKYLFDKQQIIEGKTAIDSEIHLALKEIKLDDCYSLESDSVQFLTPDYNFRLTSSSKENFLQIYTPQQPNTIAIEPMTGVADSFNNTIGLQILQPNTSYSIEWDIEIETKICDS